MSFPKIDQCVASAQRNSACGQLQTVNCVPNSLRHKTIEQSSFPRNDNTIAYKSIIHNDMANGTCTVNPAGKGTKGGRETGPCFPEGPWSRGILEGMRGSEGGDVVVSCTNIMFDFRTYEMYNANLRV